MRNPVKEKILKGEATMGSWISSGSANVVDALHNLSYDWFVFDMEHSPISIERVSDMVHVLNDGKVTPLVRIGQVDQALIKLVLDTGAMGIVAPLINSPEDAERLVRFSRYPPAGVRGSGPGKASRYGLDTAEYLRTANDGTLLVAQIETQDALKNIDSILDVAGIDVVFAGPSDLTMSLGYFENRAHPKVREAIESVAKAASRHGKAAGVMAVNADEVSFALKNGFTFISLASDMRALLQGAKSLLSPAGRTGA